MEMPSAWYWVFVMSRIDDARQCDCCMCFIIQSIYTSARMLLFFSNLSPHPNHVLLSIFFPRSPHLASWVIHCKAVKYFFVNAYACEFCKPLSSRIYSKDLSCSLAVPLTYGGHYNSGSASFFLFPKIYCTEVIWVKSNLQRSLNVQFKQASER